MSVGVGDAGPGLHAAGAPADAQRTRCATSPGKPVVLVFYPGDDTPVCTKQLNSYNDGLEQFTELDAQVLGISAQDVDSHERFPGKHGFDFPLLADTDKAVAATVRHARPDRLPAAQRVHHRRRRRRPLRPPGDRRADLPPRQRTGRRPPVPPRHR